MLDPDSGTSTLADEIDRLFRVVRRPNREPYSSDEVARACREAFRRAVEGLGEA